MLQEAAAPAGFVNGQYTQDARRFRETNLDFLVSATREFGDFGANLTVRRQSNAKAIRL